jgi:hypothetical protein
MDFIKIGKDFARNPLGIIAIFISLIYGFASLLLNSTASALTESERWPLIIFVVAFPILILLAFYRLVTKHHGKLYAPGDFKDDKSFLRTLSDWEADDKLTIEANETLERVEVNKADVEPARRTQHSPSAESIEKRNDQSDKKQKFLQEFKHEIKQIEDAVVAKVANEMGVSAERHVGIGETEASFDAFLGTNSGKYTFLEVKVVKSPLTSGILLDRLLYLSLIGDRFFESKFKLIVVIVCDFDGDDLRKSEKIWRRKIVNCPAEIDLRIFLRKDLEV